MSLPRELDHYVRTARKSVDGWLTELDARIIAEILVNQQERGVVGCVGEIGVHHGKLLLLLHLSTSAKERTFAADLFKYQDQNVDRSGHGDREKFLQNARKHAGRTDRIDVFEGNSADCPGQASGQRQANPAGSSVSTAATPARSRSTI